MSDCEKCLALEAEVSELTRRAVAAEANLAKVRAEVERLTRSRDGWEADALRELKNAAFHREKREQAEARLGKAVEALQDAVETVGSAHIGYSPHAVHVAHVPATTVERWRAVLAAVQES